MLKNLRRILAVVFFASITLLFLDTTGEVHHYLGWMAKVQLLPALLAMNVIVVVALLLVTLIFGRIYCSVICPLGVMQDIIARIEAALHPHRKRDKYTYSKAKTWLRAVFFVVMVVAIVAGVGSIMGLLAPYSSYGRMVSGIINPKMPTAVIGGVSFIIIAVLAWIGGRTYCNTVCPVGTLLGYVAKFSWFKIYIDKDACKHCRQCERKCKASCIDISTLKVDHTRCVTCGNCLEKCQFGALHYGHKPIVTANASSEEVDEGRRAFLIGTAIATATAAFAQDQKKVDGGLAQIEDKVAPKRKTAITPPGSLSAMNMARHCTGCQLCVSACPNDVLRPSTALSSLMQPRSSFEVGYCRPECTRCSEVCPTGAIQRISKEQKAVIQTGHAVWLRWNCVPLTDNVPCGNCARHCPTGAIQMVPIEGADDKRLTIPVVNEALCIGCGACENLCPARPLSAIYVEGHEQHAIV